MTLVELFAQFRQLVIIHRGIARDELGKLVGIAWAFWFVCHGCKIVRLRALRKPGLTRAGTF